MLAKIVRAWLADEQRNQVGQRQNTPNSPLLITDKRTVAASVRALCNRGTDRLTDKIWKKQAEHGERDGWFMERADSRMVGSHSIDHTSNGAMRVALHHRL